MDGRNVIPLPMLGVVPPPRARLLAAAPALVAWWDAVPGLLLALDEQGSIAFANQSFCRYLGIEQREELYGRRFGEVVDCRQMGNECGSADACGSCGISIILKVAHSGQPCIEELRLTQRITGRALDARLVATPVHIDGEPFTILAITDISDEKRRQALERIFFHDLLNTAGAVSGYAQLLQIADPAEARELASSIERLAGTFAEEIRAQQQLSDAERNDLAVHPETINTRELLAKVAETYRNHPEAAGRSIVIRSTCADLALVSDRVLLSRVLGNMVKNALEASPPGTCVTMGCDTEDDDVVLWVHNPGSIAAEVQAQIFQRSFSTKGRGRGLGTYSIRLLSEHYLNAAVSFTSAPEAGTVFRVRLKGASIIPRAEAVE